ncbi:hypothetical protein Dimus_000855 [Dionaea muscipula]
MQYSAHLIRLPNSRYIFLRFFACYTYHMYAVHLLMPNFALWLICCLLQSVPVQVGQTSPLLQYFGTLLTRGKLKLDGYNSYARKCPIAKENYKSHVLFGCPLVVLLLCCLCCCCCVAACCGCCCVAIAACYFLEETLFRFILWIIY